MTNQLEKTDIEAIRQDPSYFHYSNLNIPIALQCK